MSIVAVGTVAIDAVETPFGRRDSVLGGSATYITLAARYFTPEVNLVGVVGADFPDAYMQTLRESGVDLAGLTVDPEGETFFWSGKYHHDLNHRDTLETRLNVLADFEPVLPEHYRTAKVVCLGNLDPAVQRRVLDQVDAPELVVADTMNFWIEGTNDSLRETLRRVDVLIVNDAEVRQLAEEPNLIKAAGLVRAMGPKILVVKKGEHGALLFTDDTVFAVPAYPLEDVFDPTGAGDAFAGGFVGYLAREGVYDGDHLKRAVVYGSALASFVVEDFGPERLLALTSEQIDERAHAFDALTKIPDLVTLAV